MKTTATKITNLNKKIKDFANEYQMDTTTNKIISETLEKKTNKGQNIIFTLAPPDFVHK